MIFKHLPSFIFRQKRRLAVRFHRAVRLWVLLHCLYAIESRWIIRQRSPQDCYYQGWIRVGDINVLMRLREWRGI